MDLDSGCCYVENVTLFQEWLGVLCKPLFSGVLHVRWSEHWFNWWELWTRCQKRYFTVIFKLKLKLLLLLILEVIFCFHDSKPNILIFFQRIILMKLMYEDITVCAVSSYNLPVIPTTHCIIEFLKNFNNYYLSFR